MDNVLLMLTAGAALVIIEIARSYPAWMRVRKNNSAEGISAFSTGILAGTGPGWLAVAVMASSPAAAIATAIWMVFHALLCLEIMKVNPKLTRNILSFTGISFLALCATAYVGVLIGSLSEALGVFIAVATACFSLPSLWAGMTSASTAGLSLIALTVNTIEAIIYTMAGLGLGGIVNTGDMVPAYLLFGVIAFLCNFPRMVRVSLRRIKGLDRFVEIQSINSEQCSTENKF